MKYDGRRYRIVYRYHFRDFDLERDLDARGNAKHVYHLIIVDLNPLPKDEDGRLVSWQDVREAPQAFYLYNTATNAGYTLDIRTARKGKYLRAVWDEKKRIWNSECAEPGQRYVECRSFYAYDGRLYSRTDRYLPDPDDIERILKDKAKLAAAKAAKEAADAEAS